jgi:hypothetical protein
LSTRRDRSKKPDKDQVIDVVEAAVEAEAMEEVAEEVDPEEVAVEDQEEAVAPQEEDNETSPEFFRCHLPFRAVLKPGHFAE